MFALSGDKITGGAFYNMEEKIFSISYQDYNSLSELSDQDAGLCREAEKALSTSHSPYSHFKVGAAIRLKSGVIVPGSNQENVAYPSGLCAERVALFTVGAQFPNDFIDSVAITAATDKFTIDSPVAPCGACLQVLVDFEQRQNSPIRVLLYCLGKNILVSKRVSDFLPLQFIEKRLKTQV